MRIGVISDTHGLLRPEAEALLAGVDHILHAGDIGAPGILPRLAGIAPLTAIRGNIDIAAWALGLPDEVVVRLAGRAVLMLHDLNRLAIDPAAEGIDIVVSGHSHRPKIEAVGGVLYLNPGSAGRRRFRLPVTLAVLELGGGDPQAEIHDLLGAPDEAAEAGM
ncbi:MAG TPA: metallophosphoesterase family protein [Paracoccaceae bacterium]|nr:metallophosphoesterase family protein [Paracoccaceae bacterium]